MVWQDIVISIANVLFTGTLLSQAYHGFKTKKGAFTQLNSAITCVSLYVVFACFLTLGLYFSAAVTGINATIWLVLFLQKRYEKR